MATMVVETGAGLTTSNSYCSVVNADTYHEMRLHNTDWTGASDDNKEAGLMWATRLIDEHVDWDGTKVLSTQALRWPRYSVKDIDGFDISSSAIPKFLREATAEFARLLIAGDRTSDSDTAGFKSIKAGPLELEIDKRDRAAIIPLSVWSIIRYYATKMTGKQRTLERA